MNRKKLYVISAILTVVGSLIAFFSTNLLFSDLANSFYMSMDISILSSLPPFIFSVEFVVVLLLLARCARMPKYRKRMVLLYTVILTVLSALGFVTAILSAVLVYKDFFTPYPFKGFVPTAMLIHACVMAAAIIVRGKCKETMTEDPERRKMTVGHVLFTVFIVILIYVGLNRFGAVLLSPTYIQWSTFYKTYPFYISLMQCMAIMVFIFIYALRAWDGHKTASIVYSIVLIVLSILQAAHVCAYGIKDTEVIAAISPAMAIDRLLASPLVMVMHYVLMIAAGIYCLILTRRVRRVVGVPEKGWRKPKTE